MMSPLGPLPALHSACCLIFIRSAYLVPGWARLFPAGPVPRGTWQPTCLVRRAGGTQPSVCSPDLPPSWLHQTSRPLPGMNTMSTSLALSTSCQEENKSNLSYSGLWGPSQTWEGPLTGLGPWRHCQPRELGAWGSGEIRRQERR